MELPPRARRILDRLKREYSKIGTTSACAENTDANASLWATPSELPPRARRILHRMPLGKTHQGTTSACAENTAYGAATWLKQWNYLRVRGEYAGLALTAHALGELPPRARRIHVPINSETELIGTTSACAENTYWAGGHDIDRRNYLRVRGEYISGGAAGPVDRELPPRARRILVPVCRSVL